MSHSYASRLGFQLLFVKSKALPSSAGALLPGALVEAQVTNVVSDGLVLSFLTFFSGTVDQFHLPQVTSATSNAMSTTTVTTQ